MKRFDDAAKTVWGLAKRWPFTFLFAVGIIAITLPYNLLLSPNFYCINGLLPHTYALLTAPFNIGCEAPLTDWTWNGFLKIFNDYFSLVVFIHLVERIFLIEKWKTKWIVFLSAILATYLVLFFKPIAGSSIVGTSMLLTLMGYFGWKAMIVHDKLRFIYAGAAVASAYWWCIGFLLVAPPENILHIVGGMFFIALTILMYFLTTFLRQSRRASVGRLTS